MVNSIGLFTDNIIDNQDIISNIKNFLLSENPFSDFVIFTNDLSETYSYETAIVIDYYMSFYKGLIIFLTIEDYLIYKDRIIGKPCLFFTEFPRNIDKKDIKNCMILVMQNNELELIQDYGL